MVYCGKPSKGCAPCRGKRTKCDLGLPTCSQCVRTGRSCTGYRLEPYGEFRDQSRKVVLKHQSAPEQKRPLIENVPLDLMSLPSCETATKCPPQKLSTTIQIHPSLLYSEEAVASFFFKDYVLEDGDFSEIKARTIFCELPDLYLKSPKKSALWCIITALGLATLSRSMKRPEIMNTANAKYAEALTSVNIKLRDPVEAKEDQTLLSVMLLGMYEESNTTTDSVEPWTNHVKGALALLEYRGTQQLQRQMGLQLISAMRLQVLVNCLVRRVEIPKSLLKWSRLARDYELKDNVAEGEIGDIIAKFCNLQATLDSCSSYLDPVSIIKYAISIDDEFAGWALRWQGNNIFVTNFIREADPNIFADYWRSYSDVMVASIWNTYRSIRILVNQIIVEQLGYMKASFPTESIVSYSSLYDSQISASKAHILDLAHEICSTVPFYMNHHHNSAREERDAAYSPHNRARAKLVIWPMYVAGQADFVSDIMRNWVGDQLIKIGNGMRLGKCIALGNMVKIKQRAAPKKWRDIVIYD